MSRKAEARLAKKLEKEMGQIERSARLRNEPSTNEVRTGAATIPKGVVRAGANPRSVFAMQMRWTAATADRDGEWSWGVARDWDTQTWDEKIKPKLDEYSKLKWSEIEGQVWGNKKGRHRYHHSMAASDICQEARGRLKELACADETLFRFRLGNRPRLWGVRIVDEFQIFWYDPTHRIYPVE